MWEQIVDMAGEKWTGLGFIFQLLPDGPIISNMNGFILPQNHLIRSGIGVKPTSGAGQIRRFTRGSGFTKNKVGNTSSRRQADGC